MNRLILLSLSAFLLGNAILPAQDERRNRNVVRLQPGMAWHVEELDLSNRLFAMSAEGNPNGRLVGKGSVGRDHRLQQMLQSDGAWQDQYVAGKFLLTRQADGNFHLELPIEDEESIFPRPRPDRLAEFEWVEKISPQEKRVIDGVECEIFMATFHGNQVVSDNIGDLYYVAAIGTVDRFPRRLETPSRVLRFIPQPRVSPVDMPAGAKNAIHEYQEAIRIKTIQNAYPR